ncbi:LysR family transcriptional regulator [Providencia sp. PROV188]|jgi:DNA-binding transcriptional LysR family regulator|uniref:LysR family transcriptional regulator n=1 Tax=Providencia TaxID=586 RepID=UPI0003E28D3B|nr:MULTISPECIES: LysR family transcriptional regulator [Providencia]MTC74397.1 LysR family transcriptional regulator [Providencia sp. wls1919]ETT03282.1 LysR substrate-binding domain protein [Providencia alcalifaciens PAL-3]EUD01144.1 LysR substrate-binding domain protein [Providencia alcalifaciens PAL-1]MBS0924227.1 LysR family transcriptional regulator [Providencia sp. JGM181]MBS0932619.1 LysR family transcriptional regulator [Providencia sp. JGM172]
MNIELRHLRYFIAVAEELHFGRAAERLHMSQPPLSQQIQALEEMVNAKLLERNNRNVALTPAGAMFLKEAYQILGQVDAAATKAARMEKGELGELSIGFTSTTPFMHKVTMSLRQYREAYPDVSIHMHQMNTKQQIPPLVTGRIDIGIMRNTILPEQLDYQLLFREPFMVAVYEGHPLLAFEESGVDIKQLAAYPLVFFEREVGTALYDEINQLLASEGVVPTISQEAGEAMTILGLVSAGMGISIITESFTRMKIDGVRYLKLANIQATSEVWLVYNTRRTPPAAAKKLTELLLHNIVGI